MVCLGKIPFLFTYRSHYVCTPPVCHCLMSYINVHMFCFVASFSVTLVRRWRCMTQMESSRWVPWFPWSPRSVLISGPECFSKCFLLLGIRSLYLDTKPAHRGFSRTIQGLWHVWMRLVMALRVETMSPSQRFREWQSSMAASQWKLKSWVRHVSISEKLSFG